MIWWRAYYEIEPFGEWRADFRAAQIVSTIINVNKPKGSQPVKPSKILKEWHDGFLAPNKNVSQGPLVDPAEWKGFLGRMKVAYGNPR